MNSMKSRRGTKMGGPSAAVKAFLARTISPHNRCALCEETISDEIRADVAELTRRGYGSVAISKFLAQAHQLPLSEGRVARHQEQCLR